MQFYHQWRRLARNGLIDHGDERIRTFISFWRSHERSGGEQDRSAAGSSSFLDDELLKPRSFAEQPPPPRLVASGLACVRGGEVIIRECHMTAHAGDGVMLTGPNGSGKSTFLRCVSDK